MGHTKTGGKANSKQKDKYRHDHKLGRVGGSEESPVKLKVMGEGSSLKEWREHSRQRGPQAQRPWGEEHGVTGEHSTTTGDVGPEETEGAAGSPGGLKLGSLHFNLRAAGSQ